jgi:hypothetical protein
MITFKQFLESQDKIDYKLLKAIVDQEQAEETAKRKVGIPKAIIPTDARDGGWKIHLRTGTNNKTRNDAYELVLKIIEDNNKENAKWYSKKLHGGEPNVKDITIYCGPKEEVTRAAKAIKNNPKLYEKLLPANGDVLTDDQLIVPNIPNVYGRFDASRLNTAPHIFHQYGCKGWSMLEDDVSNMIYNPQLYNKETACKDAYDKLAELFGKYFTG